MASLLESHGEAAEVEQLHRRVWKGRKAVLGAAHPKTTELAGQKWFGGSGVEDENICWVTQVVVVQRKINKIFPHIVNTLHL